MSAPESAAPLEPTASVNEAQPQAMVMPVSFMQALRFWLKLGFISFGGPAGQIAIMHSELVDRRRWISERRFLHALNYCMLLPGPEAQQLATYLGWLMHRTLGGLVAGLLFILPSFVILVLLAWLYLALGNTPWVIGVFAGIKPAVVAIVLHAAWRIGHRTLKSAWLWSIALLAFLALALFDLPFPLIVLAAALLGAVGGRWRPQLFTLGAAHVARQSARQAPALIDDHTPPPPHAKVTRTYLATLMAVALALGVAVLALLTLRYGWQGVLPQMAWFFTKAALLTFGGAYAVLPYVYQGAVEHYGWLTGPQMIAGLALGETTPGPLIMVVTFVGFVGGWQQPMMGTQSLLASGVAAAAVVTFFTFLPSFLFILVGAPWVEATRGNLRFTAPLTAITAAVVGVIVNLALFFAGHVLVVDQALNVFALCVAAAALVALLRLKLAVVSVIALAAAAGLLRQFLIGGF